MFRIFFDVDDTIVVWAGDKARLRPGVREVFNQLRADGHEIYLWSGNGVRWEIVRQFELTDLVINCFHKPKYDHRRRLADLSVPFAPDFVIDDYQEVVDAFVGVCISAPSNPLEEDRELFRVYEVIREYVATGKVREIDSELNE
jgi:hypothetical protein